MPSTVLGEKQCAEVWAKIENPLMQSAGKVCKSPDVMKTTRKDEQ